ncbi:MAG: type III PLP-dependent enzyme [Planctomycetota bacterium]
MKDKKELQKLAKKHGTPLFIVDHAILRKNYALFKKHLPRVMAYYAVKANPDPAIVKTLYDLGSSFDVASIAELRVVYENIKDLAAAERQRFIWDKVIYANPIKAIETLQELDPYKPLVTYDNATEIRKIAKYAPQAGMCLRIRVPNTGAMVELSSKFGAAPGEAVDLMLQARDAGLGVEGISFHVGSQTTNFNNFVQALQLAHNLFAESESRGLKLKLLDIGGGFPAHYDEHVKPFRLLAQKINHELDRLFPSEVEIIAEPGRFMIATACTLVASVVGKAVRDGKTCYYIDDGIYHTYSGVLFDHCKYPIKAIKTGPTELSAVFGPTCDALDTISLAENLPALELGDWVYSENIGAYSQASSTWFNGFPPAKVVHVRR